MEKNKIIIYIYISVAILAQGVSALVCSVTLPYWPFPCPGVGRGGACSRYSHHHIAFFPCSLAPLPLSLSSSIMGHGDRSTTPGTSRTSRSRSPVDSQLSQGKGSQSKGGKKGGDTKSDPAMAEAVRAALLEQQDDFVSALQKPIQAFTASACSKFLEAVEDRISNIESGQDKILEEIKGLKETVNNMRMARSASAPVLDTSATSGASQSPNQSGGSQDVTTPLFFRKPDPSVLFCNVIDKAQVTRAKFHEAIVVLAGEANIVEDDFDVIGDSLDDRFELRFKGSHATASSKALQFYQSLQLGKGKWKEQVVRDAQNIPLQFFVQPDKNGAQVRKEVLAKHLREIVQPLIAEKQIYIKKSTGTLFVDRRPLVSIFVTGEFSARLGWFHTKRISLNIEQGPVEQAFAALPMMVQEPSP